MANRNAFWHHVLCLAGAALAFLAGGKALAEDARLFSFTTSKGLAVKVLQDNEMPFIHAELQVFLDGGAQNYMSLATVQLAVLNMFERSLDSPSSNLMGMLRRQGNDFTVEVSPEAVKIGMNFLPDRLASFSKLLKEIFTYQSFHLDKFNASKKKFWQLFKKNPAWRQEIAALLAYQQLTGNFFFTRGFLLQEVMAGVNLAHLRSFLLRTCRPDNAQLILKGKINPYFILGMIEKDLPQSSAGPARTRKEALPANNERKVFILNVNSPDLPSLFWFDIAPAVADPAYFPYVIGNFVLFGFPGGRIYQSERNRSLMEGYKVTSESLFLKDFTLICNHLRLNYSDMESFLLMVDQERKRFALRPIERKEYLEAMNFLVGQAQVESNRFDYDLPWKAGLVLGQGGGAAMPRTGPELFQEASLSRVTQVMDEQMGSRSRNGLREKGIIVLIGDADQIVSNLKSLKTEALELSLD